jgi:prevent-host-death family protein
MHWSTAEAKAKLSEVIEEAQKEPQKIANRGKPIAVVVSIQKYEAMQEAVEAFRQNKNGGVAHLLEELVSLKNKAGGSINLNLPSRALQKKKLPFEEE